MNGGHKQPVRLGEVIAPSGTCVVLDFGALHLWQHDRPPVWPAEADQPAGDGLVDLQLQGPHAEAAGQALARQWHPHFLYDWDRAELPELYRAVAGLKAQGWDVQLAPLETRVPHRERVDLAIAQGQGGGEVQFFAMTAVAVGGLPPDQPLPVVGWPVGPDDGRWGAVSLEVLPQSPVARREAAGTVVVDCARLMFADADALGAWNHSAPADGRADLVFWGRDAAAAAAATGAPALGERGFGWLDLPLDQAAACGAAVERTKDQQGLKFATDLRPHSHHHQLLERLRAAPTESGVLDLGAARVCGLFCPWGDGTFPVYRDVDPYGNLVRVTVQLAAAPRSRRE
ncbi:MAG TPA: hypothetical protein VGQ83_42800 [Polyangia bacterium]|jgi:hypothetical protein